MKRTILVMIMLCLAQCCWANPTRRLMDALVQDGDINSYRNIDKMSVEIDTNYTAVDLRRASLRALEARGFLLDEQYLGESSLQFSTNWIETTRTRGMDLGLLTSEKARTQIVVEFQVLGPERTLVTWAARRESGCDTGWQPREDSSVRPLIRATALDSISAVRWSDPQTRTTVNQAFSEKKLPQGWVLPERDVDENPPASLWDEATCSYCAEVIKAKARKCKHCKEWLEPREKVSRMNFRPWLQSLISVLSPRRFKESEQFWV